MLLDIITSYMLICGVFTSLLGLLIMFASIILDRDDLGDKGEKILFIGLFILIALLVIILVCGVVCGSVSTGTHGTGNNTGTEIIPVPIPIPVR